jgi:hypothetical protein
VWGARSHTHPPPPPTHTHEPPDRANVLLLQVNIGTELVSDPSVIFLDEPTSGLDSFQVSNHACVCVCVCLCVCVYLEGKHKIVSTPYSHKLTRLLTIHALSRAPTQAQNVMVALKVLARHGRTVVCTIHQPRSDIYFMFDKLLILSVGKLMYFGDAGDHALAYFQSIG